MPMQLYEKEEILDACFEVFALNGYGGSTTAALAEAAGVSKPLLFHHFGSKKELYLAVLDRLFERAKEDGVLTAADGENFFSAKQRTSAVKIEYYVKRPKIYKFIKEAFYETPDELKSEIKQKYGDLMARRELEQRRLFDKVTLRDGVCREQAFKLVWLVMEYFGERYIAEFAEAGDAPDEVYLQRFLNERNEFLSMIRYGIEKQ